MTLASRNWAFWGGLWLALLTVFAFALDPYGSPARESSGSAFSFFTSDVSLGPTRAPAPEKAVRVRSAPPAGAGGPAIGSPQAALIPAFVLPLAAIDRPLGGLRVAPPPLPDPVARFLRARAPPGA